ncbi:hypothetical protein [Ralstonia pseudosolanacearum]|uniref:hypothetical protein n=1 Tax=Ralstonia pseudosolanacearum TaxID=1310165 RepID=UPI003CF249C3
MDKVVRFLAAACRLTAKGGSVVFELLMTLIFVFAHPRELFRAISTQSWQVVATIVLICAMSLWSYFGMPAA